MTILIAEDEHPIREGLEDLLEQNGYDVISASDGERAFSLFEESSVDLALLDIMMPKMSGYDLCREIRKVNKRVPVIFLSAKDDEIDKVVGLELGADDYIAKPFGVHELLARIRTVLRRCTQDESVTRSEVFAFAGGSVDPRKLTFVKEDCEAELSEREVSLLTCFSHHKGEALSRDFLLNEVWGSHYYGTTRTLDQHIAKLRQKVEEQPKSPKHIITVHRTGYRYIP